jgi:hypothetical protein
MDSSDEDTPKPDNKQYLLNVEDATIQNVQIPDDLDPNNMIIKIRGTRGGLYKKEKGRFEEALKRIDKLEELIKILKIENEGLKTEMESLKHYFVNGWDKTRIGQCGNKYNEV